MTPVVRLTECIGSTRMQVSKGSVCGFIRELAKMSMTAHEDNSVPSDAGYCWLRVFHHPDQDVVSIMSKIAR